MPFTEPLSPPLKSRVLGCPSKTPTLTTRGEKTARNFLAAVQLVASIVWLNL
jgi:hypothetical protein